VYVVIYSFEIFVVFFFISVSQQPLNTDSEFSFFTIFLYIFSHRCLVQTKLLQYDSFCQNYDNFPIPIRFRQQW